MKLTTTSFLFVATLAILLASLSFDADAQRKLYRWTDSEGKVHYTDQLPAEAAKDKQGFIEGRILELEGKLATAQVIDPTQLDADGRVVFGATVDLEDEDSGARVTYQIVGDDEADLKQGRISISSPIARALIGKEAGDVAEVQAPGGVRSYEVVEVRYV